MAVRDGGTWGTGTARQWRRVIAEAIPDQGPPDREHRRLAFRILLAIREAGGLVVREEAWEELVRAREATE